MGKFWSVFFIVWPILAIWVCWIAPDRGWWFPGEDGQPVTPLGKQIDDLFYLILVIVTVVFIGTQIALGYVLWRGSDDTGEKALFSHGSHNLEVVWTIVPSGILLFIALYQMDVWMQFRIHTNYPAQAVNQPIAVVTARQFEWRIRYPAPDRVFKGKADRLNWAKQPEPGDLYTVNDLHVPTNHPVQIYLKSGDVQHAFFSPRLRIKQDAVPGQIIPVWFEVIEGGQYELICAELCGWGHYKMKARLWAQPEREFREYLKQLEKEQFDDGVSEQSEPSVAQSD